MYDQMLAELPELLRRADVLRKWGPHSVNEQPDTFRIDLQAVVSVDSLAHTLPTGVSLTDAELEFSLEVGKTFALDTISECAGQVVIQGLGQDESIYKFAMHLDRHDPSQESNELHSTFHWQVGGDRLVDCTFGTVVHLQGPRFPSPPLDPILFFDFVLGHFHGTKRTTLMTDHAYVRYQRFLRSSQDRFVLPFFQSIYTSLQANPFEATPLWPALC